MMKAMTYMKPGVISWNTVTKPKILKPTDAIGKVLLTTICGSDLHILKGDVPETTALASKDPERGLILGHEAIVKIETTGSQVTKFKKGDICIVSCITSCGHCYYCKKNLQAHCINTEGNSGWILGHEVDGTHAEYVRITFADYSLYKAPEGIPLEQLLMLSDILPTSYELGVLSGRVKEGDNVAIVGLGPIGLSALLSAKTLKPKAIIAIDMDDSRLEVAKKLGATYTINPGREKDVISIINKITADPERKPGVDVAIECVGVPLTFELCEDIITAGGAVANIGVHGKPVELRLQELWIKNVTISTGLVSAYSTEDLLNKIASGKLNPKPLITHHFKLNEFEKAYDVFKNASKNNAIKMVLTAID